MLIESKMARVVKTNLTYGTILSNIIVEINLKKVRVRTFSEGPTFHGRLKFGNLGC